MPNVSVRLNVRRFWVTERQCSAETEKSCFGAAPAGTLLILYKEIVDLILVEQNDVGLITVDLITVGLLLVELFPVELNNVSSNECRPQNVDLLLVEPILVWSKGCRL